MRHTDHRDWSADSDSPEAAPLRDRALLLTRDQAATVLTISVRQIDRLVAAGDLVPTRIGGAVRFAPRQLHAFVERSTVSNQPVPWPTARGVPVRTRTVHRSRTAS